MKQRVTFVHASEDAFEPRQLNVTSGSLEITDLRAAREDRISFALEEIPHEIWNDALRSSQQLHIRWASSRAYPAAVPFASRISPGFHLFYTPSQRRADRQLCPLLEKAFGNTLECSSPEESFTKLPVLPGRGAGSTSFQYFQLLPSLTDFGVYVQQKICRPIGAACVAEAAAIESADYMDIDYDGTSHSLTIKLYRSRPPDGISWNERIATGGNVKTLEVGVLASERPTQPEPETVSLGGFLTVIGEDEKPTPTFFSFPSRHHIPSRPGGGSGYEASFVEPRGLHPTLRLCFREPLVAPSETCSLYSYLVLPSALFPDRYQLDAPLFLASKKLRSVRSISGETDLEAPDWAVRGWGSSMLVELAPDAVGGAGPWHADVPLHLRYLAPSSGGMSSVEIPWPVVFWSCRAEEGAGMGMNPFDRADLGYDGLFGPKTMFHHLQPTPKEEGGLVERLAVPVLDADHTGWLEWGTAAVIVTGLSWVGWRLAQVALGPRPKRSLKAEKGQ